MSTPFRLRVRPPCHSGSPPTRSYFLVGTVGVGGKRGRGRRGSDQASWTLNETWWVFGPYGRAPGGGRKGPFPSTRSEWREMDVGVSVPGTQDRVGGPTEWYPLDTSTTGGGGMGSTSGPGTVVHTVDTATTGVWDTEVAGDDHSTVREDGHTFRRHSGGRNTPPVSGKQVPVCRVPVKPLLTQRIGSNGKKIIGFYPSHSVSSTVLLPRTPEVPPLLPLSCPVRFTDQSADTTTGVRSRSGVLGRVDTSHRGRSAGHSTTRRTLSASTHYRPS